MENASKALIIAGSILIAIVIISLGVVIFNKMATSVENQSSLTTQQISNFNSKITPYVGKNVAGSQVNALIQLVRTINTKAENDGDDSRKITLTCKNKSGAVISGRVSTTSFFEVDATPGDNGLLTTITAKEK